MPQEFVFFTYMLESYAQSRGMKASEVLEALDKQGATQFAYDMYELHHAEIIENAFMDLDSHIATGHPA